MRQRYALEPRFLDARTRRAVRGMTIITNVTPIFCHRQKIQGVCRLDSKNKAICGSATRWNRDSLTT